MAKKAKSKGAPAASPKSRASLNPRPGPVITLAGAEAIRKSVGLAKGLGPSAERVQRAVQAYVEQFDFWYTDQWTKILKLYSERVVRRMNPYVRRAQHGDCSPAELAEALVANWDDRNFVTAGGWALEAMAIELGAHCAKGSATGVDLERRDPSDPSSVQLYVVKTGSVTRNTDIVGKMKQNLRDAGKRLMQNHGFKHVELNYATCVGTLTTTLADGIRRPSSPAFWSETTGVDEKAAMALVWAVASAAAEFIARPKRNRQALLAQVASYVERADDASAVDWEFLARTVTEPPAQYAEEHKRRHKIAKARGVAIMTKTVAA